MDVARRRTYACASMKILILTAVLAGGCSWGARGYRSVASAPCSTSRIAPTVDAALAVAGAGAVGYGFSQGLADEPGDQRSTIIGAGVVGAMVFGAAAISGYTWASDCRGRASPAMTASK